MKSRFGLAVLLAVLTLPISGFAQEMPVEKIPPRQTTYEVNLFKTFLAIQMMEIHDQLGLVCGCEEDHEENVALQNELDDIYAYAREQTDVLIEETQMAFPGAVSPVVVRTFLEARTAGYDAIDDMKADAAAVLGKHLDDQTLEAYLLLRRNELYGLSGREPNLAALKAEIKAMGDTLSVTQLLDLLEYRRDIWLSGFDNLHITSYDKKNDDHVMRF